MSVLQDFQRTNDTVLAAPQLQCFDCHLSNTSRGELPSELKPEIGPHSQTYRSHFVSLVALVRFVKSFRRLRSRGSVLPDWLHWEDDAWVPLPKVSELSFAENVHSSLENALIKLVEDLMQSPCAHRSLLIRCIKFTYMAPAWQGALSKTGEKAAPTDFPDAELIVNAFNFLRRMPACDLPDELAESLGKRLPIGCETLLAERLSQLWHYVIQPLYGRASVSTMIAPLESPAGFMQQKRKHFIEDQEHWLCTHWLAQELQPRLVMNGHSPAPRTWTAPLKGNFKNCIEKLMPDIARLKTHLKQDHGYSKKNLRCSRVSDEEKWDGLLQVCKFQIESMPMQSSEQTQSLVVAARNDWIADLRSTSSNKYRYSSSLDMASNEASGAAVDDLFDVADDAMSVGMLEAYLQSANASHLHKGRHQGGVYVNDPIQWPATSEEHAMFEQTTINPVLLSHDNDDLPYPRYSTASFEVDPVGDYNTMEPEMILPSPVRQYSLSPPRLQPQPPEEPSPWQLEELPDMPDDGMFHDEPTDLDADLSQLGSWTL